ncbi:MAG: hypothetical protein J6K77_02270 [Ruminococcus sp.]|nr:hypothetical protein [Ruminococcus sp.]
MKKITSIAMALCLVTAPLAALPASAEGQAINENGLVYEDFNKLDVNGRIAVTVPENTSAAIDITFDSPELTDEPYYVRIVSAGTYYFDIEGHDNTDDDYRNYHISVELSGGDYNVSAKPYAADFTVPDLNEDPDSFKELSYVFSIDGEESDNDWDAAASTETETAVNVHLNYVRMGDIDGNGKIDASDAALVLREYSNLSTGIGYTLTNKQKVAANVYYDGKIDASDAAKILVYYSAISTARPTDGILADAAVFPEN